MANRKQKIDALVRQIENEIQGDNAILCYKEYNEYCYIAPVDFDDVVLLDYLILRFKHLGPLYLEHNGAMIRLHENVDLTPPKSKEGKENG